MAGNVDSQTGTVSGFTSVGAFSLVADTFSFSVPGVLSASAEGIKLGYNPQASGEQDLLKADSVTIDVETLGLTGEFSSSDTLPALLVRTDGFAFGQGTLTVNKEIKIGSVLTITNPYVTIGNFSYNTTDGLSVGSFGIGAEGLTVTKGDKFTATGTEVEASISFDDAGAVESFTFSAGVLTADIAGLVSLSATEVTFTPTATGSDPMLELGSATATVNVGKSLSLTGSAGAMTIGADGDITGPETLTISLNLTPDEDGSYDSTADKLKLPSILPIQLKELSLEWPEFSEDSSHFIIDVSATINGRIGPLTVTGGVESLKIDPYLLADEKFPIISLDGFSVSASGNLFGGEISAGLVAGIIKLDEEGNVLDDVATDYDSTVLYGGIEGGFKFAGIGGIELRLGFSELGLHQAYLSANLPGGIVLDATSGLSLNNFHGGVTFNATPLPVVDDPDELLAPIFKPTLSLTADQWREQLKEQVANQASGGSRIFTIEIGEDNSSILTDLASSTVVSGSDLADAFKNNNYSMAEGGTVTELEAGALWLVENQGAIYLIEKVDANKLDVTEVQYTMDSSLSSELGNGAVSQSIVDAFVAENINLTNSATVEDLSPDGSPLTKWKITEGEYKYFVTVRGTRLVVTGGTGSFDDMNSVLRIEAGATLYSKYVSENAFKADVDVIITTDGKFLIVGQATMADSVTADVRLFGDLSSLSEESPDDPLKLVFLANMPSQASQTSSIPELLEIKGELTFEFLDQNGKLVNPLYNDPSAFRFNLLGRAEAKATEKFKLVFGGSGGTDGGYAKLSLTVEDKENVDRVQLDVSGSLSIEGVVEATDLVSAAGSLIFQKVTDDSNKETLEVFGAVKLDFDTNASGGISLFTKAGLEADAELLFAFNSTTESNTLVLELPGRVAESVVLDPTTISLEGEGTLTFANSIPGVEIGANVSFDGAFSARISIDSVENTLNPDPTVRGDGGLDLDLFVAGQLTAGVNVGNYDFNLLKLNALGLIAIRDIGAEFEGEFLLPQIAGRVDLSIESGMEGIFEVEGSVQMLVNTLGKEFTYVIPDRLQDRLKIIQARSEDKGADQISFPVLPAVDGKLKVIVPDSPPALLDNEEFTAGPYFVLQFGDIDGEEATAGSNEPDGLTDVKMTLMDTFELSGDMRLIVSSNAFKLTARANASISVPGAGDIVQGEATGTLSITEDGFYGNLGIGITLTIPDVSMNALAYIGINTTDKQQTLNFENENFADPVIPSESAQIYLQGELNVGGLALNGSFGLFVSAESIELEVDASLKFFEIDALSVQGTAAIYYGLSEDSQNGFVLSAELSLGDNGSFGEPGIFEIGGTLNLDIDTRPASSKVQIQLSDAYVSILDALEVEGSALISYVGGTEQYFRVEGSFSGNLFDVITIDMSGFFDSRGYFGLTLEGSIKLGTDDFGVQASGKFYIESSKDVPLDFEASIEGKIRAFGVTLLGAAIGVEYDGYGPGDNKTGEITAEAAVTVLGITNSVEFTVGYLLLETTDTPALGRMDGNVLRLNVGDDAKNRSVSQDSKDEAYTITSLGDSTGGGKKIRVRAFGSTLIFDNVTSISGDFGDGDDQVSLVESDDTTLKGLTFNLLGGAGKDMMVNESSASGTFDGGLDDDILLSQNTPDILLGQGGKDLLAGGLNATLKGGDDNDELRWRTDRALPALIEGGAGTDTFVVDGQNIDEVFNIGVTGNDTITVFGASASQFENLIINGRGGADQVSVPVHSLSGVKLKVVELNLSQFEGAGTTVNDDGSTDTVTISGDIFTDKFEIKAENGDALVKSSTLFGDMTVTVKAPGQANDKLIVNAGAGADTIKLAGPKSSAASQLLSITLAGESGDDKISLPIGTATIDGGTESDTVIFTVEEGDSANVTLTDTLVSSANGSSASPHFESIQINTSIASDVTVESTFNSTAKLNLSNSADKVTVKSTAGRLLINGNGNEQSMKNDVLTLDYSSSDVALVGSMTSTTIRGFANISYSGFESLNFNLGDGSDQFTLFGTEFGTETNIFTGGGADEVYAHSASSRTVVNNVSDNANTADTLFVELKDPNTMTASPFGSYLTFTVGQVVVRDISITPASVPWAYVDGKVYVGTTEIFDTFGIPTHFDGASAVADSLKVEDKVEQPQYINVAGPQVQIQEGANVASYNSSTNFESFSYPTTVDGLSGASNIEFSPDGLHVYVTGTADNAISVFRRDGSGTLTFLQLLKDGSFGVTGLQGVDSLAISPDGKHVYAGSSISGKIAIFERVATTGRLVYRAFQTITASQLAFSQHDGGATLYASRDKLLSRFTRNATSGFLTLVQTQTTVYSINDLAVNPIGDYLYLAQESGIAQFALNSEGVLGTSVVKTTGPTNAVVVSPIGQQVYFGTNNGVEVWDRTLATRAQNVSLGGEPSVTALAIDPAGDRLLVSYDKDSTNPQFVMGVSLQFTSLHIKDASSFVDADNGIQFYFKVNGESLAFANGIYYKTMNGAKVTFGSTLNPKLLWSWPGSGSKDYTIELWDYKHDRRIFKLDRSFDLSDFAPPERDYQRLSTISFKVDGDLNEFVLVYDLKVDYSIKQNVPSALYNYPIDNDGMLTVLNMVDHQKTNVIPDIDSTITRFDDLAIPVSVPGILEKPVYGTSSVNNLILTSKSTGLTTLKDGDSQTVTTTLLTERDDVNTAISADGKFAYSVSPKHGTLLVAAINQTTGAVESASQVLYAGFTPGSSVAISSDGNSVYATNPAEDSVFAYSRDTTTGNLTLVQVLTDGVNGVDGLAGASSIVIRSDSSQNGVYVIGEDENAIANFQRNASTSQLTYLSRYTHADLKGPSSMTLLSGGALYVTSANNGKLFSLSVSGGTVTQNAIVTDGLGDVTGMSNPVATAVSPDGKSLYVASENRNSIAVFARSSTGGLTFVESIRNGKYGIQGIASISSIIVSGDGRYVIAASSLDTMAVFGRNATTGQLIFLQRMRDRANGFGGMYGVSDLDILGNRVYVSSAGVPYGSGGLAVLDLSTAPIPTPRVCDVTFAGIENLNVRSANSRDSVTVGGVTVPFTLETQGGAGYGHDDQHAIEQGHDRESRQRSGHVCPC
ncbi:MAG: beta-propeller fold lactonase family protein [Gemmataceae bacterium]